jgi:hypothetical protein
MSDHRSSGTEAGASLKTKLREEMIKYGVVSLYLFVCFGVLQWYKAALLESVGVHYLPVGVAVVKALVVGKFLLIGDAVSARLQGQAGSLLGRTAKRVAVLLVVLALLTVAEEFVVGWIHGQSAVAVREELRARSLLEMATEISLMGLILLPLVAAAELSAALGPGVLRSHFARPGSEGGQHAANHVAKHVDEQEGP